MKNLMPSPA